MSWVFAFSLLVSATLLFLLQPIIGKMVLPKFGGSPAVWNTCMLFFQAVLLAGYAYAHLTPAWLGRRRQMIVHAGLLLLPLALVPLGWYLWPFAAAPLGIAADWAPPGDAHPVPWLLLLLTATVGLPFFVLSTSAPLLQKWFAGTDRPSARDPYYLYAASNLGSMAALLGYPLLVEPGLGLGLQGWYWLAGYVLCAVLILVCMALALRSAAPVSEELGGLTPPAQVPTPPAQELGGLTPPTQPETAIQRDPESGLPILPPADVEPAAAPASPEPLPVPISVRDSEVVTWERRLLWVLRSFVPSSLMLGATTYFTTDISPIPLLWVLPLAVYLLSFILAFSRLPAWMHTIFVTLMPGPVLLLVLLMNAAEVRGGYSHATLFIFHLAALFAVAMACHGQLAQDRPPTRYLTGFFLWISLGGVLGGLFNAVVAPLVFSRVTEYPLVLIVACLVMPSLDRGRSVPWRFLPELAWLGVLVVALLSLWSLVDSQRVGPGSFDFRNIPREDIRAVLLLLTACAGGAAIGTMTSREGIFGVADRVIDCVVPIFLLPLTYLLLQLNVGQEKLMLVLAGLLAVSLFLVVAVVMLSLYYRQVLGWLGLGWPFLLGLLMLVLLFTKWFGTTGSSELVNSVWESDQVILFGLPLVLAALCVDRPIRFGLGLAFVMLAFVIHDDSSAVEVLHRERTFYGVKEVQQAYRYRRLLHGTTLHGIQAIDTDERFEPLSYYHRSSAIGQVLGEWDLKNRQPPIAVVGLGTGTMAAYGKANQEVTFYEIDPRMEVICETYFTYLSDARQRGAQVEVVLGDGRLQLAGAPDQHYGLIVLDAFSSDAIPTHLMTRESVQLYLKKIQPDGVIAFHISNRHLDLAPILARLAADAGIVAVRGTDRGSEEPGRYSSEWVFLVRQQEHLGRLVNEPGWRVLADRPGPFLWTDDYTNLISIYRRRGD